jgi:hypothetical protein
MLKPEEESPFIPLPPLQPATVSTAIYNIRYSNFFIVFAYIWVQRYEKSIKAKINLAFSSLFCKFAGDMTYEALWKKLTPLYEAGEAKAIARCSHWDRYLGMMTAMTSVPVPMTSIGLSSFQNLTCPAF